MMKGKVSKWGNSLAVRIPMQVAEKLAMYNGEDIEIDSINGSIMITPARRPIIGRYKLEELLENMDPATFPDEDFDDPPVGREII